MQVAGGEKERPERGAGRVRVWGSMKFMRDFYCRVLCAHKIMFMHVPLVFCLALAGRYSNKLQLQAMAFVI